MGFLLIAVAIIDSPTSALSVTRMDTSLTPSLSASAITIPSNVSRSSFSSRTSMKFPDLTHRATNVLRNAVSSLDRTVEAGDVLKRIDIGYEDDGPSRAKRLDSTVAAFNYFAKPFAHR